MPRDNRPRGGLVLYNMRRRRPPNISKQVTRQVTRDLKGIGRGAVTFLVGGRRKPRRQRRRR